MLQTRIIPSSGERLPVVGLGTWQAFDIAGERPEPDATHLAMQTEAAAALQRFVELGGSLVDSSPMYGSAEQMLGTLAARQSLHPKLFIATKVWINGRSEGIRQMETSLARLQISLRGPLDLMQVHNLVDTTTHLATLNDWKKSGRVRYLGITHYHAGAHRDLERALARGGIDFLQVNYSLGEREAEQRLLPAAKAAGVAVIANRPFAEGALFERVRGRALPALVKELGCNSWAQFFLLWILGNAAVTCTIPGTRKAAHVEDNLALLRMTAPDAAMRLRMQRAFEQI